MTMNNKLEWIPVAERLPEVPKEPYYAASNCVLITVIEDPELETPIKPYVTVAHLMQFRDEEPTWVACACSVVGYCDDLMEWKLNQISHWMPLPEVASPRIIAKRKVLSLAEIKELFPNDDNESR